MAAGKNYLKTTAPAGPEKPKDSFFVLEGLYGAKKGEGTGV
jgi:hypothetical protein